MQEINKAFHEALLAKLAIEWIESQKQKQDDNNYDCSDAVTECGDK